MPIFLFLRLHEQSLSHNFLLFHVPVIHFSDDTRANGLWELLDGSDTSCVRSGQILRRACLYRAELSVPSWIQNLTVQFAEPIVCQERQVRALFDHIEFDRIDIKMYLLTAILSLSLIWLSAKYRSNTLRAVTNAVTESEPYTR